MENKQVVTDQAYPRKWKPKTTNRTKTRQLASENPRKTQELRRPDTFEVEVKVELERRKLVEILFKQHLDPVILPHPKGRLNPREFNDTRLSGVGAMLKREVKSIYWKVKLSSPLPPFTLKILAERLTTIGRRLKNPSLMNLTSPWKSPNERDN